MEPAIGDVGISASSARAALPAATSGPVVFDIETADSRLVHTHPDPEGFVRIVALGDGRETAVHTGPSEAVERVVTSRKVIGHNVLGFDLVALARVDPRVDLLALARQGRVHDTMIVESVLHPLLNDKSAGAVGKAQRHFALDATAARYGMPGKVDNLAALAKEHGGAKDAYDSIPVDDERYRAYCAGDVDATVRIAAAQGAELARRSEVEQRYIAREHRVHAIASTMGSIGLAVDMALLQRRLLAGLRPQSRPHPLARAHLRHPHGEGRREAGGLARGHEGGEGRRCSARSPGSARTSNGWRRRARVPRRSAVSRWPASRNSTRATRTARRSARCAR